MNPMVNNMVQGMMGNMMKNNPMFQILNVVKGGGNPMSLIQSMAKTNPQMAQALKIINGKNPQQLQEIAGNMCKERNTSISEVAKSLGLQLPQGK